MSQLRTLSGVFPAMMPRLPNPADEVMPIKGASFEDRVLLLLAAVVRADGILTYPEYELMADIVRRIFGDKALDAAMQARFHYALLNPPLDVEDLAVNLAKEAAAEQVSSQQVEALLQGLDELCSRREAVGDMGRQLREAIDIAFAEQRLNVRRHSLAREGGLGWSLEEGARLGVNLSKAAVGGTLHLARDVVEAARKALPWPRTEERAFLRPNAAIYGAMVAKEADGLARAAWALDLPALQQELNRFRSLLVDQPFKVVLVGEGKRGKSSLTNAILGEDLSPVREAVPETASVAEFSYATLPEYQVRFLDEEVYGHLEEYLAGEEDNVLLRDKVRQIKEYGGENRPKGLSRLTSRSHIPDYLGAEGRYSSLVARVCIALPVDTLAGGMVLVDTPGLNATDAFHDYLAYEESLTADCLLVVLDARRPDSASELRLLRKLAASGRAVSIIGVMTGIDRLNAGESEEVAAERALTVLLEACRGAEGLKVLGLIPINARQAMEQRCWPGRSKASPAVEKSLQLLFGLLQEAMDGDQSKEGYRARIQARASQLAQFARASVGQSFEQYRSSLPPTKFLELLERHADQLATASVSLSEQAKSVVAAAAHEVEEWRAAQLRELDTWEELLVLRVMEAAREHADSLGSAFAKESAWKEFDGEIAPRIARQHLDDFLSRQQQALYAWNEKLRLFNDEIRQLSVLCLQAVEESTEELGDICATSGTMDHFLVQTNAHMRRLAVFLAGTGAGTLLSGNLLNLMAIGSAALVLLTHPLALPGVALVGAAAYALQSLGNLEKRKAAFLDRKRKKTIQWATEVRGMLEKELEESREEVTAAYKNAVSRGFVPALEILVGEAVHLKLYLQVMEMIREDTDAFEASVEAAIRRLTPDSPPQKTPLL